VGDAWPRFNDRGETPCAILTNSRKSCEQTTQPLQTKEAAVLGSREGPRRVYSFRVPLRGRGPYEFLNASPAYRVVPGSRNWQVETADWIWPVSSSVL